MAVHPMLRRIGAVVAGATVALAAGPMTGVALAAAPTLAENGQSPAPGAYVRPLSQVSACYTSTLTVAPSDLVVRKGAEVIGGSAAAGSCNGGTNNRIVWTAVSNTNLGEGPYNVTANARDAANPADLTTTTWQFTVDTTPPDVTTTATPVTSPITGPRLAANQVTFSATASDTFSTMYVAVTMTDKNNAATTETTELRTSPASFVLPLPSVSSLADGQISVTAVVTDAAGNQTTAGPFTAHKDTAGPAITSSVPANGASVPTLSAVTATFDETLDAAAFSAVVRNKAGNPVAGSAEMSGSTGKFTAVAPFSEAGSPYAAEFGTRDLHGNTSTRTVTFTVDDTAPPAPAGISVTNPINADTIAAATVTGSAEKASTVTAAVSDGTKTITGSAVAHVTSGAFTVPLAAADLATLAQGPLTVRVSARDAAGNTSSESPASTVKDTIRPAVTGLELAAVPGDSVALTGSTEPGLQVTAHLVDAAGARTADVVATAGGAGAFSLTIGKAGLTDPSTVTAFAYATDAAGNTTAPPASTKLHSKTGVPTIAPLPLNAANADDVVVSGTAPAGSAVDLLIDDADTTDVKKVTATTAAGGDGAYATSGLLDLTALADGPVTVTVTARDGAGAVLERAVRTVVKDTEAPAAPTGVTAPEWVNTANLAVAGAAPEGSTVTLTVTDGVAEHAKTVPATMASDGTWAATIPVAGMNDGPLVVSAVATDAHGNSSARWTGTTKKDTVAPAAPLTLVVSPDPILTGNAASTTVSGTGAEPSSTVTVTLDDADADAPESLERTVTADATGAFTAAFADADTLSDGVLTASAKVTDAATNTGPAKTDTAQLDTTQLALVSTTPADGASVKTVPTFTAVFNEPLNASTTVVIRDSTASPLAGTSALSADKRSVVFTPAGDLTEAGSVYTATITGRDALENDTVNAIRTFTVDRTAPVLGAVVVNGGQAVIDATDAKAVPVTGATEPGAQVTVSADDTNAATAPVTHVVTAQPDGTYSASLVLVDTERYLDDGAITVTVSAVDAATNASSANVTTSMDATVPAAPTNVTLTDPVNAAKAGQAVLAGSGEPNGVLHYVVQNTLNGPLLGGTVTIAAGGTWTKTLDLTGIDDGSVRATTTVKDAAGNESAPFAVTVVKDTVAPAAPQVSLSDPVNKSNQTAVTVSGKTFEPGLPVVVTLTDGGTGSVSDSTVTSDVVTGAFSKAYDVTALADGPVTVTVTATDAAGNVSPAGTATATKDSAVPDVPVLNPPAAITHATHSAAPFSGTAEQGSTVSVTVTDADDASVSGSTVAGQNGAWSKALDVSALRSGTLAVLVTATDPAGNANVVTGSVAKDSLRAFTIAVGPAPVSGAAQGVTVTAHQTSATDSPTDTTFTGTPVLTSLDGHFTPGTCAPAVAGVASCTGTVFGDLGLQTLRATSGSGNDLVAGASTVTVQPTGLAFSVAPPATAVPDQSITFTVVPTAGVTGASVAGYTATRKLQSTGGTVPQHGSVLSCPAASCEVSVTFVTRGPKTISVVDNGTPARQTPVASITIPYRTSLPLFRSHTVVPYGAQVLVIGELTNTSNLDPVPGKRIEIWRKVAPATTYSKWTTVTTDADGIWYVVAKMTRNTTFQARFLGDATYLASRSATGLVRASQVVSSTWSRSGRTVKATGRVSPNAAGRTVYLQYRKADGSWVYSGAKATVTSTGTYTVRKTWPAGKYVMRVYVPATAINAAGLSRSYTIT